jgi:DNA mismatch repair protein MutS2
MAKSGLFVPAEGGGRVAPDKFSDARIAAKTVRAIASGKKSIGGDGEIGGVNRLVGQRSIVNSSSDDTVRMPYYDNVLADIGDDQSLVQSLSTFSGHIQRIKRILVRSTRNSMCLFDEVGSGTDPAEGSALAMALLRHLAGAIDGEERRAALTFATTHHGELKTLKYSDDADSAKLFENASVEFDDVKMAPTFRLLWGIPGRSNALAIARRLGLHEGIVESAEQLMSGGDLGGGRVDVSKMIADLERSCKAAEDAKEQTEAAWKEVDTLRRELKRRLREVSEAERKMQTEQRKSLDDELEAAKKEIGGVIKDMQRAGLSARSAGEAASNIDAIRADMASSFTSPPSTPDSEIAGGKSGKIVTADMITPGCRVMVPRLGASSMEVVDIDKGRKEVTVLAGTLRAKIKIREIASVSRALRETPEFNAQSAGSALARQNAKRELKQSRVDKRVIVRTAASTIDVRGERVEEAEAKVDVGISRCLGLGRMWIIHGHGTGRLKSGLRAYLKLHEHVKRCVSFVHVTLVYFLPHALFLTLLSPLCVPTIISCADAPQNDGGSGKLLMRLSAYPA